MCGKKTEHCKVKDFFWMCVRTGDRASNGHRVRRGRTGDRGYPMAGGQDPGFAKLEMHRKNRGPTQRQKVGEKTGESRTGDRGYPMTGGQDPGFAKN